jgi:hypothetical protein
MTLDPFVKEREKKGKDVRQNKIVTLLAVTVLPFFLLASVQQQKLRRPIVPPSLQTSLQEAT